jgi:hypothetical protein
MSTVVIDMEIEMIASIVLSLSLILVVYFGIVAPAAKLSHLV